MVTSPTRVENCADINFILSRSLTTLARKVIHTKNHRGSSSHTVILLLTDPATQRHLTRLLYRFVHFSSLRPILRDYHECSNARSPGNAPTVISRRIAFLLAATVLCTALAACVNVRLVDEDRLPEAWKREINQPSVRLPQGRFAAAGQLASGKEAPVAARLEAMFMPGQIPRSARPDVVELNAAPNGTLIVRAIRWGAVVASAQLPYRLDPKTGWLEIESIAGTDASKFGRLTTSQSVRVGVGTDGALYVRMSGTAAGVVLFMPAVGAQTVWGRWEPAAP